ncbi:protein kinase, partial [bacterium]|nr:protein kinase [bacterium]
MRSENKQICEKCNTENPVDNRFCKQCGSSLVDETSVIDFELTSKKIIGNRYEIISELGKGAMGVVYKVWDQKLDRFIALKAIKFEEKVPTRIAEIRKRMITEAKAVAKLKHPNIVTIHDVIEEGLNTYIAMEFIDGIPLSDIINIENKADFDKVINIMVQICSAISHAHESNIIHRDLKPANIMLEKNKEVKITDFGIA